MANLLKHLIEEEKKRNIASKSRLFKILKKIPAGRVYKRKIAKKEYVYLSRRVPKKLYPESVYIGAVGSEKANQLIKKIEDRVRIQKELKSLDVEFKMLEKALSEYRKAR
jgi:hypothetical protein